MLGAPAGPSGPPMTAPQTYNPAAFQPRDDFSAPANLSKGAGTPLSPGMTSANSTPATPTTYLGVVHPTLSPRKAGAAARIDPTAIPRPRYNIESDPFLYTTYKTTGPSLPPAAFSYFVATDAGNCNPRFMRSTMYQVCVRVCVCVCVCACVCVSEVY